MWMIGLLLSGVVAFGQTDGPARKTGRLIGLVEVPALFGVLEPGNPGPTAPKRVQQVELRSAPALDADVIERVSSPDALESREHGYEHLSAVVCAIHEGWHLVRYSSGSSQGQAWLSPKNAGSFRLLGELLKDGLAHLTRDWDRRLFVQPERRSQTRTLTAGQGNTDVVVADFTRDDRGEDWFLVVVLDAGRCRGGTYPAVIAAGWVPAHSPQGKLQTWFYSRGC